MKLQSLARALAEYRPREGEGGWRVRLGLAEEPAPPPMGLYIFGKVGRGKSMLMDMFFDCAALAKKRRVHFYGFMQEIHARIHARRDEQGDPIGPVARAVAEDATLLCFDEFQVTDIADAMILGRLFAALFAAGVVVVATSNRAPDELYKDGLQRERFLPFIALLKERLDVLELEGSRDFRLARFVGRQVYFTPANDASYRALERAFADLTDNSSARKATLAVQGRTLDRAARGKGRRLVRLRRAVPRAARARRLPGIVPQFPQLRGRGHPAHGPRRAQRGKAASTSSSTRSTRRTASSSARPPHPPPNSTAPATAPSSSSAPSRASSRCRARTTWRGRPEPQLTNRHVPSSSMRCRRSSSQRRYSSIAALTPLWRS